MGNVTVNVYSDDECTEGDTISLLKTLINLVTDNFNNINLKLKEMDITLDDVKAQVDDLKTQVADVKTVNTKAYQDLEAVNVDLKAQLDAATQGGGTILDTAKLQTISDKIKEVSTDLANSVIGVTPVVPTPDPTPVPDPAPTPDPTPTPTPDPPPDPNVNPW